MSELEVRAMEKTEESEWLLPEAGELVIGTIVRIMPYGAYAALDEYEGTEGLLHISEISSRWVKNIRDHVRERQKAVLKVLRVDREKRHIDLSLRRVNEREKREKLLAWKRELRGRKLFDMAIEKLGIPGEEAYNQVGRVLEDRFGSLYDGFEQTVIEGDKPLLKAKIPSKWVKTIAEIAEANIRIPLVKVKGTLEVTCTASNGVTVLRNAFNKAKKVRRPENTDVKVYVTGAPKYRVEVSAKNYKEAESLLDKIVTTVFDTVKAAGGDGKFTRASVRR
jgi:translation initiation factor 2 subunit 1